jgi:hypothetical protein
MTTCAYPLLREGSGLGRHGDGPIRERGEVEMQATTDKVVMIRARAFTGDRVRAHQCLVDSDGTVRVWDSIAGHYTACHILDNRAARRARKLAEVS